MYSWEQKQTIKNHAESMVLRALLLMRDAKVIDQAAVQELTKLLNQAINEEL